MKKILFISLMALCAFPLVFAQTKKDDDCSIDELKERIEKGKDDTTKVNRLNSLSGAYIYIKPDSAMFFAKEGLELAEKIKWEPGAAKCLNDMGATQQSMGNYPQALDALLKALKISEERNDKKHASVSLDCVGNLYIAQGEYRKGLKYLFDEKGLLEELKQRVKDKKEKLHFEDDLVYCLFNISIDYQHLNEVHKNPTLLDSSTFYQEEAYRIAFHNNSKDMIGPCLINLATLEELKNHHAIALAYFRQSIPYTAEQKDSVSFCQIYGGLAEIYKNQKKFDSAYYYGKMGLTVAQNLSFTDGVLNSCKVLTEAYKGNNNDSCVKYLELTIATKDSLFNQTKAKALQTLGFNENLRQQEIEAEKEKQEEERTENLQLLGIAVFVVFVFVLVLSLSRVRINPKYVEAIGVVSVLMLFEFISMFLHPIIEEWTGHSIVLVFLILVGVANILVPLHHKMEHWLKHAIGKRAGLGSAHAHAHVHTPDGHIETVDVCEENHEEKKGH